MENTNLGATLRNVISHLRNVITTIDCHHNDRLPFTLFNVNLANFQLPKYFYLLVLLNFLKIVLKLCVLKASLLRYNVLEKRTVRAYFMRM